MKDIVLDVVKHYFTAFQILISFSSSLACRYLQNCIQHYPSFLPCFLPSCLPAFLPPSLPPSLSILLIQSILTVLLPLASFSLGSNYVIYLVHTCSQPQDWYENHAWMWAEPVAQSCKIPFQIPREILVETPTASPKFYGLLMSSIIAVNPTDLSWLPWDKDYASKCILISRKIWPFQDSYT